MGEAGIADLRGGGIENPQGNEYDQPSQRRWRRIFGHIAATGPGEGDDGALTLRGRAVEAPQQANEVLVRALESETFQAVSRSEVFLREIGEGQSPTSLRDELVLAEVSSADLHAAVLRWVALNRDSLQVLREDAETCRRHRNDISVEGLFEFCLTGARAEESLCESLRNLFTQGLAN